MNERSWMMMGEQYIPSKPMSPLGGNQNERDDQAECLG